MATTVPTCIEDHRDAEKRQAYEGREGEVARLPQATGRRATAKHAYLSGRDEPGRVDFKHYSFIRTGHDQFFSWLDADFAKDSTSHSLGSPTGAAAWLGICEAP